VRVAEQLASLIAGAYRLTLDRLELTPEQWARAPAAVRAGLELIEGGHGGQTSFVSRSRA
jgi:hypothetical protein